MKENFLYVSCGIVLDQNRCEWDTCPMKKNKLLCQEINRNMPITTR